MNIACCDLIDKALASFDDPKASYVLRSRIRRAVLAINREMAELTGAAAPSFPESQEVSDSLSDRDRQIIKLNNNVLSIACKLSQPSESFGERWVAEYSELRRNLKRLRQLLTD